MEREDMLNSVLDLIKSKCPNATPLLITLRGSHAYGTNIETSDHDFAGVFIQSEDDIIGRKYVEQINDDKNDIVLYELRRFLELCENNNPNILELLYTPEDCVLYKNPIFDEVLDLRDSFITKKCGDSFGGYAKTQVNKARGKDKKQNWEKDRVTRKTPIDFCYLHLGNKTVGLHKYLEDNRLLQTNCGLSKVANSKDLYNIYYDYNSDLVRKSEFFNLLKNLKLMKVNKFRGIGFEGSNELRLSSIPKGTKLLGFVTYNKDGYSQHCKDFREYEEWIEKRNNQRFVDVKSHDQKIDGKNMMHCYRLSEMAMEISEGMGINVRRLDSDYLISIRRGEVDLRTLIISIESTILHASDNFRHSKLPDSVDPELIDSLLLKIRKKFYNLT